MDLKSLILLCIVPIAFVAGDVRNCNCTKVDGGFSEWTQFTPCSTSCGNGVQKRYRFCSSPYPENGGASCFGATEVTKSCNIKPCPTDCDEPYWGRFECGNCTLTLQKVFKKTCHRQCFVNGNVVPDSKCKGSATKIEDCEHCIPGKWRVTGCGNCTTTKEGKCAKKCHRKCYINDQVVADSFCIGLPTFSLDCDDSECRGKWKKTGCDYCVLTKEGKCAKTCYRKCYKNDQVVADSHCVGSPTYLEDCDPSECDKGPCHKCYTKALEEAKNYTGYWRENWVGHACRDSEVPANLHAICKKNKHKQSINGGLYANNWFWIHCSADGPWCKPCATRTLVFSAKCDACLYNINDPCPKKKKW